MSHDLPDRLGPNFWLSEMYVTGTGIPNTPSPQHVEALRELVTHVLQPWRDMVGALRVTSGYRSPAVNAAVGGSASSQHLRGEAADVVPLHMGLDAAWRQLTLSALPYDQAIVYVRPRGEGWVHVSYSAARSRRQLLVQVDGGYREWRSYGGPIVLG